MIELTINSLRQVIPDITEQIYVGDTLEDITVRLPSSIARKNIEEFEIKMRAYVDDETYFEYPIPTDKSSIDIDVGLALTDEVRNLKVLFVCTHASGEVGKTNFVVLKVEQSPDGTALSHTIEITENGEYDVTKYTEANVDVPEGITVNESYDISEGTLNSATVTLEGDVVANIPDGVTTISNNAFMRNDVITKVIMPNSVLTVEDGYSTYETVGAFSDCKNLADVVFSENLTKIAVAMFYRCPSLTSITIPDSVTSIGDYAFEDCTSLTSITIPDSVTSIGDYAFYGCPSLTSITIPDSVTSLGSGAFGNTGLTSIVIPDSVTSIGERAFDDCNALTDIYYTGTQAEWEQITIGTDAIPETATIHYEYTPN